MDEPVDIRPIKLIRRTPDEQVEYMSAKLLDVYSERTQAQVELDKVNEALHEAGIDYPTGARGVRDLASQRDSWDDRAAEMVEDAIAPYRELLDAGREWRQAIGTGSVAAGMEVPRLNRLLAAIDALTGAG